MTTKNGNGRRDEYRLIGQDVTRIDAGVRTTGQAEFAADITRPATLFGKVLRSPHAHARIRKIDTSRAAKHPGVKAIITGADMPAITQSGSAGGEVLVDLNDLRDKVLAQNKANWQGHPVAVVAATSPNVADEAAQLIEVDYELLPIVEDIRQAIAPGAPLVHETVRTKGLGDEGSKPSNVAVHMVVERGDVEAGFAGSDLVLEHEFSTPVVHQGYLEPHAATGEVDSSGHATVWTTTQGAFGIKTQLCALLDIAQPDLTVIPTEIGGGFGGKNTVFLEPLALLLARKTGQAVKLVMTREETLKATGPTSASLMRTKLGVTRDGLIQAVKSDIYMDAGAYPGSSGGIVTLVGYSYYKIPNIRLDAYDVVTNKPHVNAYRAPGGPMASFPLETMMDEMAEELGIDAVDLRLKNLNPDGELMTNDVALPPTGMRKMLEEVRRHPAWTSPVPAGRGRGLAIGFWGGAAAVSSSHLTVNADATFSLVTGSVDVTGVKTVFAQIVAEELGVEVGDVRVTTGDTDQVGYTDGSWGSRTAYATGTAVFRAAKDTLTQLTDRAAQALQATPEEIVYKDRTFSVKDNSEQNISLAALAQANARQAPGPIIGRGTVNSLATAPSVAAHVAEVEFDPDTGRASIPKYTAFQDPGKALNPPAVVGQIQGAVSQGIGWALWEGYDYKDGQLRNATLLDYRTPTALDVPMIDVELVETPAEDGAYGARGVGEVCIIPPISAISNAIARATSVRLRETPFNPEQVFFAMRKEKTAATA